MKDDLAQRSLSALLQHKRTLLRKRKNNPEMEQALDANIADLDKKITARLNASDKRFHTNFYKIARTELTPEVLEKIENIASTRTHQHARG